MDANLNLGTASISTITDTFTLIENAIGSDHADTLVGNASANILQGGAGGDLLTGGAGSDVFKYAAIADCGDTVTDFNHSADSFRFSASEFGYTNATWSSAHFFTSPGAMTGTDCFLYDSGTLYFDADGQGGNAAVSVAECTGSPTVDHTDITFDA